MDVYRRMRNKSTKLQTASRNNFAQCIKYIKLKTIFATQVSPLQKYIFRRYVPEFFLVFFVFIFFYFIAMEIAVESAINRQTKRIQRRRKSENNSHKLSTLTALNCRDSWSMPFFSPFILGFFSLSLSQCMLAVDKKVILMFAFFLLVLMPLLLLLLFLVCMLSRAFTSILCMYEQWAWQNASE